ncbi:MAG: hypothetical protein D3910_24480, partial [Candidatus Electrothrix sp. ATG2]|nr:hypothetical protein [Candidatus Electrothrix sp. ATG2]
MKDQACGSLPNVEYRKAVTNLIEPLNPALITAFLIYKDTIEGRKPFPCEPYCYGLFDTLVSLIEVGPWETVLLPRYCPDKEPEAHRAWEAGFEEAEQVYNDRVKTFT